MAGRAGSPKGRAKGARDGTRNPLFDPQIAEALIDQESVEAGMECLIQGATGRPARLIELDPRYVDVIVERWQDYTAQNVVLENDGREFEQIALERS